MPRGELRPIPRAVVVSLVQIGIGRGGYDVGIQGDVLPPASPPYLPCQLWQALVQPRLFVMDVGFSVQHAVGFHKDDALAAAIHDP